MTSLIDEVRFYNKTLTDADIQGMLLSDVTAPGDNIQGVPNDGIQDGSGNFGWPDGEYPWMAIDDDTGTKFLHFKGEIEPTGIQVEPAIGPTIVTGLTLTTANDAIERDPASFELSGSNDSIDGPYELIAAGDVADFADVTAWPRFTMNATAISFENTVAYKYYQVMFPTVRDAASANSMQIAEVELLGVASPLVGHWKLDGDALDSSGYGNDGVVMGDPQWVEGIVDGAIELDGDGDFVDCGNSPVLAITGDITVACWIKVNQFTTSWQAIVTTGDSSWRVHRSGGTNNIAFGSNGLTPGGDLTGSTDVSTGAWFHVAAVYNGAQKLLYIDGALDASADTTGNINASTYNVNIGENNEQTGRFFDGLIDDVRIYNQALSAAEISEIVSPEPENLVANGGLEDDLTGAGWSTYGDATMEVVQELVDAAVPDAPIEGSSSLHVTVGSAGANFWDAGLQHSGKVFEAGKSYTLSVWFKSKSGLFNINIKPERAANPWEGYGSQEVTITEEWAEYTVNTGVIPETVDPASLTFHIAYAPGEFWADNLLFTED